MTIREIEKKDNEQVEKLIRTCLLEFGANKPGCAWEDPFLGTFYEVYQPQDSKYWIVEEDGKGTGAEHVIGVGEKGIRSLLSAEGECTHL